MERGPIMFTIKSKSRILSLVTCTFMLAIASSNGCAQSSVKQLNEESGRSLLKEAVAKRGYMLNISALHHFLGLSLKDYTTFKGVGPEAVLKKLVERHLVQRESDTVTYPKISGAFMAQMNLGSESASGWQRDTWVLTILPQRPRNAWGLGANAVRVTGRFYSQLGNEIHPSARQAEGAITSDGRIALNYLVNPYLWSGPAWKGVYEEDGATAFLKFQVKGWTRFIGKATGQKITVNWYEYSISPELSKQIIHTPQGPLIAGGKIEVETLSELKLVSQTEAVAQFTWNVPLNDLGAILLGHKVPAGNGTVSFAEKPDGTWFVDHVSF